MFIAKYLVLIISVVLTSNVSCQFLAGGRKPVDLKDFNTTIEMINWAKIAINEITKIRRKDYGNDAISYSLIRVLEATKQIVSGINYRIKLRMKDAYCRMNCAVEICSVTVYSQPWTNTTRLTEHDCKSEKLRKLYGLGRVEDISTQKGEVISAVNYAVNDANLRSNQQNYFKLIKITSAKHQLVSGSNYFIEFDIGETNCVKKSGMSESQNCSHLAKKPISCNVDILDQPWMPHRYKITRSDCEF